MSLSPAGPAFILNLRDGPERVIVCHIVWREESPDSKGKALGNAQAE